MSAGSAAFGGRGPGTEGYLLCPCCGTSDAIESNLVDETFYRDQARAAPMLRHLGAIELATDLMTSLASVVIVNWARLKWRCACGATFDE